LIVFFMCYTGADVRPAIALRCVQSAGWALPKSRTFLSERRRWRNESESRSIKASGVPFEMPTPDEQAARLRTVLHVLYLIFNEGYTSSTGSELHRTELSDEAIRLTRLVHRLLPDDGAATGLLGLMLLIDARRPARTDAAGDLIPLGSRTERCGSGAHRGGNRLDRTAR
jgi:predicted RNA polymerase sigma factor